MLRDENLIMKILQVLEDKEHCRPEIVTIENCKQNVVNYHLLLLRDAGFIEADISGNPGNFNVGVYRLTWQGHDYSDQLYKSKK